MHSFSLCLSTGFYLHLCLHLHMDIPNYGDSVLCCLLVHHSSGPVTLTYKPICLTAELRPVQGCSGEKKWHMYNPDHKGLALSTCVINCRSCYRSYKAGCRHRYICEMPNAELGTQLRHRGVSCSSNRLSNGRMNFYSLCYHYHHYLLSRHYSMEIAWGVRVGM